MVLQHFLWGVLAILVVHGMNKYSLLGLQPIAVSRSFRHATLECSHHLELLAASLSLAHHHEEAAQLFPILLNLPAVIPT